MTYNEILPLVRREPFVPLRVHLHDGRAYELQEFGNFMLIPSGLTVRIPYLLERTTTTIEHVRIAYSEIKEVTEVGLPDLSSVRFKP